MSKYCFATPFLPNSDTSIWIRPFRYVLVLCIWYLKYQDSADIFMKIKTEWNMYSDNRKKNELK